MDFSWGVSIIVCCHNSALKLPATLNALFRLKRGSFPVEVIIVDNNSSDNTTDVALELAKRCKADYLQVLSEKRRGLSFARRAGILAAKYEVIIFCDDDNLLCEDYAIRAYSLFISNPRIGAIGGMGRELLEGPAPAWWPMFSKSYAVGPQGDSSGPVGKARGYVYGAGMCARRSVLRKIINFNFEPLLKDRSGRDLTSGGDVEICFLILAMDYEIWYDECLKFDHVIDESRLTWEYYLRLKRGISSSFPVAFSFRLFRRHKDVGARDFVIHYLRMLRSMLRRYFDKGKDPYKEEVNRLVAKSSLGYLVLRPFLLIRTFCKVREMVMALRMEVDGR